MMIRDLDLFYSRMYNIFIQGKGGLGSTKFVAFETLAWHNECFYCNQCKVTMVGKGFIQVKGIVMLVVI